MTPQDDLFIPQQRSEIRPKEYTNGHSQGTEANKRGQQLEEMVASFFTYYGVPELRFERFTKAATDMLMTDDRSLVRQYPYRPIIRGQRNSRIDMVYHHGSSGPTVAIECKVQDGGGSVDEKLYGIPLHAASQWKFADCIWVVLSGTGFRSVSRWKTWLEVGHRGLINNKMPIKVFTSLDELRPAIDALVKRGDAAGGRKR